jgi:hypothetical protein
MSILPPIGVADDGVAQRDAALNRLRFRPTAIIRDLNRTAPRVALDRGELTDDVRAVVPIPAGISPKLVGEVFRDFALACVIRRAGFKNSTRPLEPARLLSVWQFAAAVARLAGLEGNP